jgi:uncharacterized pyridoxamine 5'-phosphate oxidase family protein
MTKEEIFEFVTKSPVFALATSEENRPHVRYMMLYRADENGIIFSTGYEKDVHKQLGQNPQAELCFLNQETNVQVRIEGSAEVLEDLELKKQIVADFPFLKEWIDSEGYDVLITYAMKDAKATIWTMESNFQPKQYIQL